MQDLLYLLSLMRVRNVGTKTAKELISHCGSASEVFKASQSQLLKIPNIGEKTVKNIKTFKNFDRVEKELQFIQKNKLQAHSYLDKTYPQRLKHYPDAPIVLFQKGNATLNPHRSIAIVGTRKATSRGMAICEKLVENLKEYNITINSGLAYGIDVTAHRKCVDLDIPTIGVLAHGLDRVYPYQHKSIAQKMLQNGSLLTEYPSETNPDKENFPSRNRIIAGMSDAVIVVETKITGGSMITAHIANEYNKDVFAVPGRLNDIYSQGCNHLIKTHKAALIESAEDIGYIMRWEKEKGEHSVQRKLFVDLTEEERVIVELLRQSDEVSSDKLTFTLKKSTSQIAATMLGLEFRGIIKTLPGSRFTLVK